MGNNVVVRNVISYSCNEKTYVSELGLDASVNRFESNVVYRTDGPVLIDRSKTSPDNQWAQWQARGFDRNSSRADPKVITTANAIPTLALDSPAFRMGFKRIPIEQIGPFQSDCRASWPIVEQPMIHERID